MAVDVLVRLDMGADNAFSRGRKMMQELKTRAQESSDAAKIMEVLDAVSSPESLVELALRVESSIQQREDANKGVEMTKQQREAFNLEIIKEKNYLKTLQNLRDTFLDKNGKLKSDVTANEASVAIVNEFANYNGRFADREFQEKLADYLLLEAEGSSIRELFNRVQDPKSFEENFLKGFVREAKKSANQQAKAIEVKDTSTTGTITDEDYQQALSNIPIFVVAKVENILRGITEQNGKFLFGNREYTTEKEAIDTAINSLNLNETDKASVMNAIGPFMRKQSNQLPQRLQAQKLKRKLKRV